jgi:hypothetical protein
VDNPIVVAALIGLIATSAGGLIALWGVRKSGQRNGPSGDQSVGFWAKLFDQGFSEHKEQARTLSDLLEVNRRMATILDERLPRR